MKRFAARLALVMAVVVTETPAAAYLKLGTMLNGQVVDVTWQQQPIRYFVSDYAGNGVSAADLRGALARAAATWSGVDSATVRFEFQGMTAALPEVVDGRTTIGFLDRPDLDQVLGVTSFLLDSTTGAIVEADVFFNSRFVWSVSAEGTPGRVDLESVALHELGHLLGLGHSAIGETERTSSGNRRLLATGASMFPIAMMAGSVAERVLHPDDVAGVSDLYPAANTVDTTGGIVGRVTKNGQGLLGAHVVAFNPETGELIGNFTLNPDGEFVIARLPPGPYILRVEPVDDAEIESFFSTTVDLDFRVTYAPRMVVAPRGGSSGSIEIQVSPK
ncbi:MAG TPA: carboxypeptidase-like regulatory domain-containing protein [Vicinamibacterales bacterium]|nr:carboxypeptidase-like regulatory domain-containing protein [Vicinamibacterales bacterium]